MARHLWAFCVALATAAQPQNATRQLDAYDPPPTDLSIEVYGALAAVFI